MKTEKNKNNTGKVVAIGAGVAALAAAGYFFFGPKGKQHRTAARGWMIKMKGEVIEKMEAMKDITEDAYHKMVDGVAAAYTAVGGKEEVAKLATELKKHWKSISNHGKPKAKKAAPKAAKKSAKKSAKKTIKK